MHRAHCLPLLLAGLLVLSRGQLHLELDHESQANSSHRQVQGTGQGSPSLQVAPGIAEFAFRLYHLIVSESPGKNVFFSPLSISACFAMLSLGTRGHSQTQVLTSLGFNLTELSPPDIHRGFRQLLHVLGRQDRGLEVRVGSVLLLSHDLELLPGFLNDTAAFYDPQLFHTNFQDPMGAIQLINDYIKMQTRGKIVDLISELSPDNKMVLVNYIYFKGLWQTPFPHSTITTDDFHVDENTVVKVPMMSQHREHHWYLKDRYMPCSVLRLDYQGSAVAFFILPDQGKMKQVEQILTPEMLERWNRLLQNRYFHKRVELHFPKFSISGSYALDQILPKLGFEDLFSQQANFSGITKQQKVQVSKSFHKAILDVNEVGTEAAAATSASVMFLSAQHNHRVLRFNRPFFVVIYSTSTHGVLFLGKVVNPTAP